MRDFRVSFIDQFCFSWCASYFPVSFSNFLVRYWTLRIICYRGPKVCYVPLKSDFCNSRQLIWLYSNCQLFPMWWEQLKSVFNYFSFQLLFFVRLWKVSYCMLFDRSLRILKKFLYKFEVHSLYNSHLCGIYSLTFWLLSQHRK